VHAIQRQVPILSMIASFQRPSPGLDHAEPMPTGLPDPETLPTLRQRYGADASPVMERWLRDRPMDLRHVEEPVFVTPALERSTSQHLWMRAVAPIPDGDDPAADAALHAAVLAYASDYSLLEPILRGHGRTFAEPGMRLASLDHAMWWHRPARADEWLLFVLDSPSAQGSRGLGRAAVYRQDGTLVASVVQEGMVRADLSREGAP
jgi:acyl-CoA thioesterase-2